MEPTRVAQFDDEMYSEMNGELIYENDIPDINTKEASLGHPKYKRSRKRKDNYRWKPNGITDNREEWKQKYNMFQNITGCYTHDTTHEFLKDDRQECLECAKLATELYLQVK